MQILTKVKIPLAGDAIMLGVNQGIIMVLSVVVIGGLVGSGGLGYEVAQGLVRGQFGQGVIASVAILALGIALDRVTQGSRRQRSGGRRRDEQAAEIDVEASRDRTIEGGSDEGTDRHEARSASRGSCVVAVAALAVVRERAASRRRRTGHGLRRREAERERVGGLERRTSTSPSTCSRRSSAARSRSTNVTENQPSFQAMADGKIDVVLEDWDNLPRRRNQKYLEERLGRERRPASASSALIGWYIPRYLLKQYPQFATWKGLKGKESVFKSPESGSQGMFLGGDPSYVQKDKEIIAGLGLNLKHVVAGAEPAQVARWTSLYKQKKPVLFYWYTPQYLNVAVRPRQGRAAGAHEDVCRRHDEEGWRPRRRTPAATRRPSSTS